MPLNDCDNILVRGVNWIGDAVMTMPAIRALRLARRGARITLLVKPWVAPLFEKDPNIDEIIPYLDEFRGIAGRIRLARGLRERHFCAALLLQNAFDAAAITALAGIPDRAGYARDGRRWILTQPVTFDAAAKRLHHIDYYLNLVSKTGLPAPRSGPWMYLTLEERMAARGTLKGLSRPVVAINPGATYGSSKRWLPERFAGTAMRVLVELGGSVLVLGGPSEKEIAAEIVRLIGERGEAGTDSRVRSVAGATSLRELAALISESDLLITNDSGPMHIGYAVGTPVVAVFGSTSPELTGPVGGGDVAIRKTLDCAPCFERECRRNDLRCMDLVTSDEVFEAARGRIGRRRAVFFDRDGTLCRDADYLSRMEDLQIFPEIAELKRLKERGLSLIGVSNQSGVARGIVDQRFVEKVNGIFIDDYGFDAFYYCPHHPEEHCSCRKPEPGLLHRARVEQGIDLKGSYVVGDKEIDMVLAKTVGARGILVRTGKDIFSPYADFVVDDLAGATEVILQP
ncbi:MAG: lipopolysaccharide heptosyltransferase II [Nitrospiraceae bacterium]|nr:lipopolysaccharide heptosyltransferase II [Nitrospiraceae bacterium]